MTEQQLENLLQDMSLEEKIGQLLQLTGDFFAGEGLATGPMEQMQLSEEQVKLTGSILSTVGAKRLRSVQDSFQKSHPHHIPLLFMADVINGYRTVFPIPIAQGCAFSPELAKEMARISAKESARAGIHVTFSPMVDLVRDPRWGRVLESTGEDPYLNGLYAKAMVEGYQGKDFGEQDRVCACIKHFAAYGAPTGGREYNQVELSERSLYEEYLPAYQEGIQAGAGMVMTSFNTLGRIPCTGNAELMQGLLREKWGFDGVLISDWAAIRELIEHSIAEDEAQAAYLASKAGVDIDMVTNIYSNHLAKLVREKQVPEAWVDASVRRILTLKNKLGLFENPYKDADEVYDTMDEPEPAHRTFAREAIPETVVLLKNDDFLPLNKKKTKACSQVAFIGPYMEEQGVCGAWSLFYDPEENITLAKALAECDLEIAAPVAKGCSTLAPGQRLLGFQKPVVNEETMEQQAKYLEEAVRLAKESQKVILALGECNQMSGEGAARTEITIPEHQMELFRQVHAVNENVAVICFSGRPLDLREISAKAKAVLQVWFPGSEAGHGIMDVIFGDTSPSGRLAMSFPYNVGQVPVYYRELHTGRRATAQENRFCSRYIDAPNEPLYCFGYGLDYTTYAYEQLQLSKQQIKPQEELTVSVKVTNTGTRAGKEVVQLYLRDVTGSVARPVRQLVAFEKVALKAGETKQVSFTITYDMLKFYDSKMQYVAEPGKFEVYAGGDSRASLMEAFTLLSK